MKVKSYIACLVLLIGITACKNKNKQEAGTGSPNFFDLKTVVNADIKNLTANKCSIKKDVVIDGKSESQLLGSVDFEKELQPLIDCDINKAAWKDKFLVDSIESNGEKSIHYSALSDKVNIKSMRIIMDERNEVKKIEIRKEIRSFTFSFDSEIEYFPGKGYDINTAQKAFLIHTFAMQVHATFIYK